MSIRKATYHYITLVMLLRRFVPRTSETAYIYLMKGSGCSSTVGRSGSRQTVSLGLGCVYSGEQTSSIVTAHGLFGMIKCLIAINV